MQQSLHANLVSHCFIDPHQSSLQREYLAKYNEIWYIQKQGNDDLPQTLNSHYVMLHIFSSMNRPLIMVERFVCPGDPWSYVLYRISQGKQALSEGPD